ncbi:FHA domain-containing protein [Kineococcus xinjiangensis]|uniref:FHA domain-containing protein n=1 Tax=Kineococcus xinjiangensis TaxID=512762 RepID=A0A2S6ID80_9ACTN|nr:FHA domain-containing protein [Kineococcus xinjiangensis]PPK92178.1 FHA domain-containing protein [Kineococcus xinjiangensis]
MSPSGGGAVEPDGPGARPPAGAGHGDDRSGVETTMSFAGLVPREVVESVDGELSSDDQLAVDALPPDSALLVVRRGPNAGARFLLDAPRTSAGRHPSSDIFLDDVTVSRRHAEFVRDEGGEGVTFRVVDVGSLNGTYVDRERIDEKVLRTGDEVQIGKFRMVFHAGRHAGPPPAGGSGR